MFRKLIPPNCFVPHEDKVNCWYPVPDTLVPITLIVQSPLGGFVTVTRRGFPVVLEYNCPVGDSRDKAMAFGPLQLNPQ